MLLNYYDSRNRVIDTGKSVVYSREKVYGEWTYLAGVILWIHYNQAWKYTRTCTKSYKYVGMDFNTALQCANAMKTYYTRQTYISDWQSGGQYAGTFATISGGNVPMADVTIQIVQRSKMYDVVINVNEYDERWSMSILSPSSLFTQENQREYDED